MAYIYDILLNFNDTLVEYFLWKESDSIKYVKKIALFKVDTNLLKDLIDYEIEFDKSFTNKLPSYEMNGEKDSPKLVLLTDGLIVIGVIIKENKPVSYSRLLLDEEYEVLEASNHLEYEDIKYIKLNKKEIDISFLTTEEKSIQNSLYKDIDKLYKEKDLNKLKYLYYEYTNKECNSLDYMYNFLKKSLSNFNDKHRLLFDILTSAKTKNN